MTKWAVVTITMLTIGGWTCAAQAEDAKPAPAKGAAAARLGDLRKKLTERLDKNGDGKIDAEERKAIQEELTKRIDAVGNGQGAELRKKLTERFDKNGDGKIDAEELKALREDATKRLQGAAPGRATRPKAAQPEI